MTSLQKTNKPLFSQHYLDYRIQECAEWQFDMSANFDALLNLYLSKKDLLPKLSEAQTEEVFIKPALDILGFSNIPQVTTRGKGRAERPDYALFTNEGDRDNAYPLQDQESAFYTRVSAIAEAKYWERALSKPSANDQRDIYKNANPSFQITNYLVGTGVDWGILTNGREWRLYYRLASSTATEFYQVDLVELLESQVEDKLQQFKYFWLFFCSDSFVKDPQGRNFLERVRDGSNTYATQVGKDLKALVFEQVFPSIAGGFAANAFRKKYQVTPEEIYESTLSFLYKLLFLLYAESRNLLPVNGDYCELSLIEISRDVSKRISQQRKFSQVSTFLYDRIINTFNVIDQGDDGLKLPRYNGGLFHFNFREINNQIKYAANYFLSRFKITDEILAPALDKLFRIEGQPIDYSFLGVRQLGSIYEGLLEYRVVIDNVENGGLHLENDKGERKSTGSYYTPDYIVKYIVSHTLKPILERRSQRFSELMTEINNLHQQLQDKRLGVQSRNGIQKDLQRLGSKAQTTLLDIKVCDPSMGSGHFLVEAVDYLTDQLILILNQYPEHNPILEMLNQTRQSILENLAKQGISISPDRLEPTQLLQRVIMKRCIYGVDLNPMAVELAKVSLWLHSFTVGAPLSFLDHHLRCGNSLIGTTAKEAETSMKNENKDKFDRVQLQLLTSPFVGLLRAAEIMRGVSILSDATLAEVEQSEKLFHSFDEAAKPYKRLLDIYVAQFFGLKQAKTFLRIHGANAITNKTNKMKELDREVYEEAQKLSEEKQFFHWDLEFPEVFIDLDTASWKENSGFDAVLSNPPYIDIKNVEKEIVKYIFESYETTHLRINIFASFMELASKLIITDSGCFGFIIPSSFLTQVSYSKLRKKILENNIIKSIVRLPNELFGENKGDVKVDTCLITIYPKANKIDSCKTDILVYDSFERIEIIAPHNAARYIEIDQVNWLNSPENIISITNDNDLDILGKIRNISKNLEDYCEFCLGITPYDKYKGHTDDEIKNKIFHAKSKIDSTYKKLLLSGDVSRYQIEWNGLDWINYGKWLGAPREEKFFKEERILVQQIIDWGSLRIFASLTNEELYNTQNQFNLLPRSEVNLKFILSIFASRLILFYHRKVFLDTALQRFQKILIKDAKNLPIRKIEFTTPIDRRQQLLQNAIALYNQYQSDRQIQPILNQVNHHLIQQPEEGDVIHDLLAYLAGQMIELNKQKQTEIKSFLQWLERFICCSVDTLTNKSKIQNYLGDYYKNMPHVSFEELIEVLKKNSKKIKIDPVARKDQQTLEKEYQDSLNALLPIKQQLTRCDQLIDAIVYRLYGLTEAEIAIVEGKTN